MEIKETKFSNKILLCVDCGEEFVFTASAQEYFLEKGYTEDPRRCKTCYLEIKRSRESRDKGSGRRGTRYHERSRQAVNGNRGNGNGNGHSDDGLPEIPDDFE